MESGAVETTQLERPPGKWRFNRRFMGIALVTEAVVVFLAYMVVNVPVMGPKLTAAEVNQHWVAAVVAATAVALGVLMVVALTLQ